jgi:hypothetical protein
LVEAYLNSGDPIEVLARQMPEPRDPFVQAAAALGECLQDRSRYEEAAKALGALDLSACDPALHIILLDLWTIAANDNQRYEEVTALARRARALVSPQLPAEIRALVSGMESFRVIVGGDLEKRSAKLKEYLELMPAGSPRRPASSTVWLRLSVVSRTGGSSGSAASPSATFVRPTFGSRFAVSMPNSGFGSSEAWSFRASGPSECGGCGRSSPSPPWTSWRRRGSPARRRSALRREPQRPTSPSTKSSNG